MNKKAVSMAFVMAAIIILLMTFALLYFLSVTFEKANKTTIEEKCQVSVQREATLNMITKQTGAGHTVDDFAGNVECQEIPLDLKNKNAQETAATTVSLMEKCWNLFGSGKKELFSSGSGLFCHKCYVLTIDPSLAISLEDVIKARRESAIQGNYDVPKPLSGENQAVVFVYARDSSGIVSQKVYVRALGAMDMCKNAVFPAQRLT
jgi:hypothetical protein